MKIKKLKLRGAIGIWKGLGKEEIEIDFSEFGSGLIALTGKNGSGKTTVMENLHPYRCMVSRTGSLQSHFFLKDSYRILEFEHSGDRYESKIMIDALTGGSEAYLLKNGQPMNDGKLTTYDEAIESVLGSQELFFNSVFSGQKSKGIAELKPSERRKLFYELLSLDVYEKYLEKAKAELKANELKLSEIEGKIQSLKTDDEEKIRLENERIEFLETQANIIKDISIDEEKIAQLESAINDAEKEKVKIREQINQNSEKQERLEKVKAEIKNLAAEKEAKINEIDGLIIEQDRIISRNLKILENKDQIQKSISRLEEIETEIARLNSDKTQLSKEENNFLSEVSKKQKALNLKKDDLQALRNKITEAKTKYEATQKEISQASRETQLIAEVPCNEQTGASCQFLKNAFEKKEKLPELTKQLETQQKLLEDLRKTYDANFEKYNTELLNFENTTKEKKANFKRFFDKIEKQLSELNNEKQTLSEHDWKMLAEEASKAETAIQVAEQKKNGLDEQINITVESYSAQIKKLEDELSGLLESVEKMRGLKSKLEEIILKLAEDKTALVNTRNELETSKDVLRSTERQIAEIEAKQKAIAENEQKAKELEEEKQKIQNEIKDWTFLAKAFDKTGIPVLKLENSGVQITAIANELLSLFENQFRIVFETTQLTKDKKKMKETFNINIISGDDVVEISNLSGGQQVWVETAIQLAISLLVREQGIKIETSFLDEKDGALDIENAHLYLQMLKLAHQKSGVHNTFVITHRPELIDLIPQKISLEDGLIKIETESFSEVA